MLSLGQRWLTRLVNSPGEVGSQTHAALTLLNHAKPVSSLSVPTSFINSGTLAFMLGIGLIATGHASINTFSTSGLNVAITDDAYNGTLGTMASVNLPVALNETIQSVSVTVGIAHTWIGDLVIKLRSPSGTVVTLLSRPGVVESADDGAATGGDSSNLSGPFPITFTDGVAVSAENMGNTLANGGVVCQNDLQCTFDPNKGAASGGNLASLSGQNANGTWTLLVGDGGTGDTGTINQFSLTFSYTSTAPVTNTVAASIYHAVQVCWPTETAHYYQVQRASSLTPTVWTNFGTEITGNGLTNCVFDATSPADRGFYRVLSRQ